MPIKIPNRLPATQTLENENIFVMTETRAITQDIRPLRILLLNLMPTKIDTETQLSRLLGNSPLQVELVLMHTRSHQSKNTSARHLLDFYQLGRAGGAVLSLRHPKNPAGKEAVRRIFPSGGV